MPDIADFQVSVSHFSIIGEIPFDTQEEKELNRLTLHMENPFI